MSSARRIRSEAEADHTARFADGCCGGDQRAQGRKRDANNGLTEGVRDKRQNLSANPEGATCNLLTSFGTKAQIFREHSVVGRQCSMGRLEPKRATQQVPAEIQLLD